MKGNLKLVDGVWVMKYDTQEIPVDSSSFIKIKSMNHDNSQEFEFEISHRMRESFTEIANRCISYCERSGPCGCDRYWKSEANHIKTAKLL